MRNVIVLLILVCVITACSSVEKSIESQNEEEAVIKALDGFYESLNLMFEGDATVAKKVWSQSEEIIYMGADGGYNIGWDAMYSNWVKQAELKLGGKVTYSDLNVNVGKNMAVTYQLIKSADAEAYGINKHVELRASSVFKKEGGKWKMIGHHVDVIPQLEKEITN